MAAPQQSRTDLPGFSRIAVPRIDDERGGLDKFFAPEIEALIGRRPAWRQVLRSRSHRAGTLRGLHAQLGPWSEAKLIVPLGGRVFWVAVDLRAGSDGFGHWQSSILSAGGPSALFIERGFGHGCLSLDANTDLLILADNAHAPGDAVGIAWDDPELAVDWPLAAQRPLLSEAHAGYGSFARFRERYGGL